MFSQEGKELGVRMRLKLELKFGANLVFDVPTEPGNPDEDEQQPEDSGLTCEIQYSFESRDEALTAPQSHCPMMPAWAPVCRVRDADRSAKHC